jgi:hypothetical protein
MLMRWLLFVVCLSAVLGCRQSQPDDVPVYIAHKVILDVLGVRVYVATDGDLHEPGERDFEVATFAVTSAFAACTQQPAAAFRDLELYWVEAIHTPTQQPDGFFDPKKRVVYIDGSRWQGCIANTAFARVMTDILFIQNRPMREMVQCDPVAIATEQIRAHCRVPV